MDSVYDSVYGSGLTMSLLQKTEAVQGAPSTLMFVYAGSMVGIVSLVIGVYFNRGFLVISRVLAYLLSLSTMTIAVKSVYVNQHFNYPKFVTCTHFLSCGILCFGIMLYKLISEGKPIVVPTLKQQTHVILPIAVAFAVSVGANNIALLHSNAAFAEMIGAAAPLCVIAISLAMGKGFDLRLIVPVLVVMAGVAVCASGELKFTWFGFALIFLATFLRGLKTTLQHSIMEEAADGQRLDPIELLAWMSPPCLMVVAVWSLMTEGMEPFHALIGGNWVDISLAIGLTCVNACILNVANNFVIKDLGAVGCLLASQLKGILLLLGAAVMLGEVIQGVQIAGYVFIAGGVYWYNSKEKEYKAAKKAEVDEESQEKVPLRK